MMFVTQEVHYEEEDDDEGSRNPGNRVDDVYGELVLTRTSLEERKAGEKMVLMGDKEFIIGRANADFNLMDAHVSGIHAKIYRDKKHKEIIWIIDSSTCGTFVNGERLKKNVRHRLRSGDTVSLVLPKVISTKGHEFIFSASVSETASSSSNQSSLKLFEKYEILETLGNGSYATVKKGINKLTGEEVAIKIIEKKQFRFDPERWEAQFKEIEIMKQLEHPYIVKLLDAYQTDHFLYMVLDFMSGGELFDRIVNKGPYPEEKAKILMKNILEAVEYLHSKSIIHRDLKPENILLSGPDSDTDIKVADFGVAREISTTAAAKTVIGSLSYIAPEVLERRDTVNGLGSYGKSADIWSLGVITFVTMFGKLPFNSATNENIQESFASVEEVLRNEAGNGQVSREALDFMLKLLVINPNNRSTISDALNHPWILGTTLPVQDPPKDEDEDANNEVGKKRKAAAAASSSSTTMTNKKNNNHDKKAAATPPPSKKKKNNNNNNSSTPVTSTRKSPRTSKTG